MACAQTGKPDLAERLRARMPDADASGRDRAAGRFAAVGSRIAAPLARREPVTDLGPNARATVT